MGRPGALYVLALGFQSQRGVAIDDDYLLKLLLVNFRYDNTNINVVVDVVSRCIPRYVALGNAHAWAASDEAYEFARGFNCIGRFIVYGLPNSVQHRRRHGATHDIPPGGAH